MSEYYDNNIFITNLKRYLRKYQISQKQLSSRIGVAASTVTDYVKGRKLPRVDTLDKICRVFNCERSDLLEDKTSRYPEPTITEDIVILPVLGSIAAGYDELAMEDWSGNTVLLPAQYFKGRNKSDYFVLEVKGDSMYPLYLAGDKVLVLKQSTVNASGDVAAVLYDDNCGTLKKVEYIENGIRLVPINAMYPPMEVTGTDAEHCRIMGVPKLLIRDIK